MRLLQPFPKPYPVCSGARSAVRRLTFSAKYRGSLYNSRSLLSNHPAFAISRPSPQTPQRQFFTTMPNNSNKTAGDSNANGTIDTSITTLPSNTAIATITISRPAKLNALNTSLLTTLPTTIQSLTATHPNLLAIVLTGTGTKSFIGGADIAEMASLSSSPAGARAFITKIHAACKSIRDCPVPVIARINGIALGAGLEIAAACDMRIASSDALLGMPEVAMGVPSVVEAALLPGLIGWGRTRQLLLLGETIDAREALGWGLVEKVVEPAELDKAVAAWVGRLEKNGMGAVRNQKELIGRWEQLGLNEAIEAGIDHFGRAFEVDARGETEPGRLMGAFLSRKKGSKL